MVPLRSTICNAISYKKTSMASEESLILVKVCEKPHSFVMITLLTEKYKMLNSSEHQFFFTILLVLLSMT